MRIHWIGQQSTSPEAVERNIAYSSKLDLRPVVSLCKRLAVVGGGPSIGGYVDELRAFDGDVWAINGAFQWCRKNGMDAWFVTVDPAPVKDHLFSVEGVTRAIVSNVCDPSLFEALAGSEVYLLPLDLKDPYHGPSTATAVPLPAAEAGYREITYYGCEGSYGATTHAYQDWEHPEWIAVSGYGQRFVTKAEYFMQTEFLATLMRRAPLLFKEKSGGLLRAMIDNGMDYDVVNASPSIIASLRDKAA